MTDCAIIGGGPAGVSAAINLKLLNKSFLWFSAGDASKKVERAELIQNFVGLPAISGEKLGVALKKHVDALEIEMIREVVNGIYQTDGYFTILASDKQYEAKSVILCLGVQTLKPIVGEEEFLGRGVSYCATCDGFLYKGKSIAVLCLDKSFEHEVEFLCSISDKAYVMPLYKGYKISNEKAKIILKQPLSVEGDMRVKKLNFKDESIDVDGLFVLRDSISPAILLRGLKIDGGHIEVKRDCSTNIDGVFAAGDCTGRPYQYAKSIGEGNIAAHSAVEYLAKNQK